MKLITRIVVLLGLMPWIFSCASNDLGPAVVITCNDPTVEVSYNDKIMPIVDEICSNCHNSSFPGKDWTDPLQLQAHAAEAKRRVSLPASHPDHMPRDPYVLTAEQIQSIVCWADQGAPINN